MTSRLPLRVITLIAVVVVATIGMRADSSPSSNGKFDTVRAKKFELLDDKGQTLLVFSAQPQGFPGVMLSWRDEAKAFASLLVAPGGEVFITVRDLEDRATGMVSLGPNGAGTITIEESRHRASAVVGVGGDGSVIVSSPSARAE